MDDSKQPTQKKKISNKKAFRGLLLLLSTRFGLNKGFFISIALIVFVVLVLTAAINSEIIDKKYSSIISLAIAAMIIRLLVKK